VNNPEVPLLRAGILGMLLIASFATEEGFGPDLKALVSLKFFVLFVIIGSLFRDDIQVVFFQKSEVFSSL